MAEITRILEAIDEGDAHAAEELLPLVYNELRRLAAQKLSREKPGQTLQATALVHEAYIRLVGSDDQQWDSRGHFFAAAAEAMRRILIDNARRKECVKHGGASRRVHLVKTDLAIEAPTLATEDPTIDLVALDDALAKLGTEEPKIAELVNLRFFAGLTMKQTAQMLGIPLRTAERHWTYARAWLHNEINGDEDFGRR